MLLGGRDRNLTRLGPEVIQEFAAMCSLLVDGLVEFSGMRGLIQYLRGGAGLCPILIRRASHLLPRSWYIAVVSQPKVFLRCQMDHRQRRDTRRSRASHPGLQRLRLRVPFQMSGSVGVDDIPGMTERHGACVCGFGRRRIPDFGRSRSLLPCKVFLGEPLLPRLALPIIISHASAVDDHPAAELSEH